MPRRSGASDLSKRVSYSVAIAELMSRDPLFTELSTTVTQPPATPGGEEPTIRIPDLQRKLHEKYGRAVWVHVPIPSTGEQITFRLSDFEKNRAMEYTLSTITFAAGSVGPERAKRSVFFPNPSLDRAPALYVRVDLSRITLWDLNRVAADFNEVLRNALRQSADLGAPSDPRELAFLKTVRPDVFYRDLRRYDLHVKHGATYRLIGLLETHGGTIPPDTPLSQHRVGKPISSESTVSDSVRRIYQAIHRVRYTGKSRQLDGQDEQTRQYHCPEHGTNCPALCPQVKEFQAWFNKTFRPVSLTPRPTRYSRAMPRELF